MNIGIDIRTLAENYRTGVGELTTELLNAIFGLDTQNQYYLFANGAKVTVDQLPRWNQPNVHYVITHYPNKLLNLALLLLRHPQLDKLIARRAGLPKLDIFFSPTLNFLRLSKNARHFLFVHDLTFALFPWYYTARQRLWHRLLAPKRQMQNAAAIFAPSENTKRDAVENFNIPAEKITMLAPGLSPLAERLATSTPDARQQQISLVRKKYQLPEHFILFVGTIEPRKNLLGLITAFERAYSLLPTPYSLVIAGAPGWKNEAVYKLAEKSKVRNQIKFLGYVTAEEKPALFSAAEIFVYPSFYEGFGFPVLEAMTLGVPVITSNRSSLPEITGSSAYLINPHRPEEIASGIRILLTDREARAEQIKNGLEKAREFNWELAANQWLAAIGA